MMTFCLRLSDQGIEGDGKGTLGNRQWTMSDRKWTFDRWRKHGAFDLEMVPLNVGTETTPMGTILSVIIRFIL